LSSPPLVIVQAAAIAAYASRRADVRHAAFSAGSFTPFDSRHFAYGLIYCVLMLILVIY